MSSRRSRASKQREVRAFDFRNSAVTGVEWSLIALLAAAVLAGGGGVGAALGNLAVQLVALACLAFNRLRVRDFLSRSSPWLRWLAALTLALPLAQLIPLPPFLWHALPGRDLVVEATALIGADDVWRAFTVDFAATALSALSLVPPLAVLALAVGLNSGQQTRILLFVVALALLNLALGALQLSTDNQYGNPYPDGAVLNNLYGTFANRNSAGLFLLVSIVTAAAAFAGTDWLKGRLLDNRAGVTLIAIGGLLAVGVVLTQSRSATLLFGIAIAAIAGYRILRRPSAASAARAAAGEPRGSTGTWIVLGAVVAVLLGIGVLGSAKFHQTGARFAEMDGTRVQIWDDAMGTAHRYWPLGSGTGTFDQVFQVDETLEHLSPGLAGRAHNDLLEIAIESGIVGLALLAGWVAWLVREGLRARDLPDRARRLAALLGLVLIGLQSLVDYPLRNEAMLCIAALLIAVLGRPSPAPSRHRETAPPEPTDPGVTAGSAA